MEHQGIIYFWPTVFIINNSKFRLPLSLGFDIVGYKQNKYFGIGGIISFNYSLTKNIYIGINLEVNYGFNNPHEEIVGYKDTAIGVDESGNKIYAIDSDGNPIKLTPIKENKNHFGNNLYVKPTIGIGVQF